MERNDHELSSRLGNALHEIFEAIESLKDDFVDLKANQARVTESMYEPPLGFPTSPIPTVLQPVMVVANRVDLADPCTFKKECSDISDVDSGET
jgi:hypothetical protein